MVRKLVPLPGEGKFHQAVFPLCVDLGGDEFWRENSEILGLKPLPMYKHVGNTPGGFPIKRQINDLNGDASMKPNLKSPEMGGAVNDAKMKAFDSRMADMSVNVKGKQEPMSK